MDFTEPFLPTTLALVEVDADFAIVRWSHRAEEMFGWTEEEVLGLKANEMGLAYEEDLPAAVAKMEKLVAGELQSYVHQNRNLRKDGSLLHCEWYVTAVRDVNDNIRTILSLVHDVTDQEATKAELVRYRDHLEELVKVRSRELENAQEELVRKERLATLGQLTGSVAHELRNPLGTIQNSLDLVKQIASDDEKLVRAIERATRNSRRCNQIIEELLDFTRTRPLNLEALELGEWLESVVEEYDFPERINFSMELGKDIRVKVEPERLRRCVVNLLSNAVEVFPAEFDKSAPTIKLSCRVTSNRVEICVSDNGPGIAEEQLGKIFEPLFSTKGFGVGLGLSIVEQIMSQHGGGVEIDSTEGEGTNVCLYLPLDSQVT